MKHVERLVIVVGLIILGIAASVMFQQTFGTKSAQSKPLPAVTGR